MIHTPPQKQYAPFDHLLTRQNTEYYKIKTYKLVLILCIKSISKYTGQ
jgi:hypothetical protein